MSEAPPSFEESTANCPHVRLALSAQQFYDNFPWVEQIPERPFCRFCGFQSIYHSDLVDGIETKVLIECHSSACRRADQDGTRHDVGQVEP